MAEGSLIYRPSLSQISFEEETIFNETAVQGAQTFLFGLTPDEIDLPDPEIDWQPIRSAGYGADVHVLTQGVRSLTGSIPIVLQDGRILKYVMGACANVDQTTYHEHTITGTEILPSICIESVWNDGTNDFLRYFTGVKCSGATLGAEEDGQLKCNVSVEGAYSYASAFTKTNLGTLATTKPYMFYEGSCSFWGTTFARVKSWDLDIKRTLTPRRYLQDNNPTYPYEINEGARDITLSAVITSADDIGSTLHGTEAYKELMDIATAGFDVSLTLARDTHDKITISNPTGVKCQLKTAKHPRYAADAEDAPITVEIVMKSVQIVVEDQIVTY